MKTLSQILYESRTKGTREKSFFAHRPGDPEYEKKRGMLNKYLKGTDHGVEVSGGYVYVRPRKNKSEKHVPLDHSKIAHLKDGAAVTPIKERRGLKTDSTKALMRHTPGDKEYEKKRSELDSLVKGTTHSVQVQKGLVYVRPRRNKSEKHKEFDHSSVEHLRDSLREPAEKRHEKIKSKMREYSKQWRKPKTSE